MLVPAAHGEWLAAHVPGAITRVSANGHAGDPDEDLLIEYRWLLDGTADWD